MSDFKAKCTKFDFRWRCVPDPAVELTALPQTVWLDFRGLILRGWKRKSGRKRKRMGEGSGREIRGGTRPPNILA